MSQLINKSLSQIADGLKRKEFSSAELVSDYISQTSTVDDKINSYITRNFENALEQAYKIDKMRMENKPLHPLAGAVIAIKDNICTKGLRTTCGSRMLESFIPPYDATVIARLKEMGVIISGKTNMDEFGMGSTGKNSAFGITRNPLDLSLSPGGSSSGSAAAVASGQAPIALGSDTGGSVRLPASLCGLVGMKPSYGTLSRYGLVSFAPSLDQIGIISKNIADNALLLSAIAGLDPMDATSVPSPHTDYSKNLEKGVRGLTVAIPDNLEKFSLSAAVTSAFSESVHRLTSLGCNIVSCSLPEEKKSVAAYYIICCAEACSNLARFDGIRYGYRSGQYQDITSLYVNSRTKGLGDQVKKRILLGTFALSREGYEGYYQNGLKVRQSIKNRYAGILSACHAILTPCYPDECITLGQKNSTLDDFTRDLFNIPANLCSLPSISIPISVNKKSHPIGVCLTGRYMDEATLYQIANAISGGAL